MIAAESNRRSKQDIAAALKAQVAALTIPVADPTAIVVSGAGDVSANGRYSLNILGAYYERDGDASSRIYQSGSVWFLDTQAPGHTEYQSTGANIFGAWTQFSNVIYAGPLPAPTVGPAMLPAFQRIEVFDVESLTDAFRLLTVSEQRVCLIVLLDEQFETLVEGRKLFVTRLQPAALLISDRILGDRVKALWGDAADATAPGAFALAELALPAVTGQLISAAAGRGGILAEPKNCYSIFLKDEDRQELPGRAAVSLELTCRGGTLETHTDPGPTL